MALKVGELYAALTLATDSFKKGLDESHSRASAWAGKVGGVFKTAGMAIAGGLLVAAAAITAIGIKSLGNAEEQERANERVKKAFGKSAAAVTKWAEGNAMAFGVADDQLELSVSKYVDWAKNAGVSTRQATTDAEVMARRASEIALVTGKSYDEVFQGLMKGAQGSTKAVKEYGVAIDKNAIQDEAYRMGLIKKGETVDATAAAEARASLILNQTAGFTKSAADMDSSYAKGKLELGVIIDQVMDTIGAAVMTIVTAVMPYLIAAFEGLSAWINENGPAIQAIMEQIFQAVSTAISWVATNVIPALGVAFQWFVDNVIPVLAAAFQWYIDNIIPALAAAFEVITKNVIPALGAVFEWIRTNILPPLQKIFQAFTDNILPMLQSAFEFVQRWISDNWPLISKIVGQVGGAVKTAFDVIAAVISAAMPVIKNIADVVFPVLGAAASAVGEVITRVFDAIGVIWQTAADVADTVVKAIFGSWEGMGDFFSKLWKNITSIIKGGINWVISAINGMIDALNGIQIHIPGFDTPVGHIGNFDWNGLNLGHIPYLAKGMWNVPGPQLAYLHAGEAVLPATAAADYRRNRNSFGDQGAGQGMMGGITQHIYGVQPGDVERETKRALRRQALDWALEGRT